ncbi:MAG TPA: hypothetical protein DDW65_21785 [Firmicutes bacterium]|nr:hypothetical protein [Bacillota bacterium]
MKRTFTLYLLFMMILTIYHPSSSYGQTSETRQSQTSSVGQQGTATAVEPDWWAEISQTFSLDYSCFYGESKNGIEDKVANGFHLRPGWQRGRFEGRFDFAFYQNPWDQNRWQWGVPQPDKKPVLPNFIDKLTYHGDWMELNYQKIADLNFGYGLLINDYHSNNPYQGWTVKLSPFDNTSLTYVASQELFYLAPFTHNEYASLHALRADQAVDTGSLHWQLGFTGVHDSYSRLDRALYPAGGSSYDLTLTNVIWASPFWETAALEDFGGADMLGFKGRLGMVGYQAGAFRTHGKFRANFFGGNYEALKLNSWAGNNEKGLPSVNSTGDDNSERDGWLGRLSIAIIPWLNFDYLTISDLDNMNGYSLIGKIERLGVELGATYYQQHRNMDDFDFFIRGGNGFWGYEYHCFSDWNHDFRTDFELTYKF